MFRSARKRRAECLESTGTKSVLAPIALNHLSNFGGGALQRSKGFGTRTHAVRSKEVIIPCSQRKALVQMMNSLTRALQQEIAIGGIIGKRQMWSKAGGC